MASEAEVKPQGLDRLELRIERLQVTFRFTFAFHAREVRFERDSGSGFERIFPETFSFHVGRHDPTELFIQLDDLMRKPRLIGPRAHPRDSRELVHRLIAEAPRYLERICKRLELEASANEALVLRVNQDVALLAQVLLRFHETRDFEPNRSLRMASHTYHRRIFRSLQILMAGRVAPDYLERYVRREVDPVDPTDDPSESGLFHILESGEQDAVDRIVVRMAERAFHLWLERVCLDESNDAFEKEDSPFASREEEVLAAITTGDRRNIMRGTDLSPFLRRGGRDCLRLLEKLERWFLHQYDIEHSSAIIHHRALLERGVGPSARALTWHTQRIHVIVLCLLLAPFALATFVYQSAPYLLDAFCTIEVVAVNAVAIWFLLYRFCWKRDLSFFHASVPRIGAGIIVGYLPVFLIDEVWSLAGRSAVDLISLVTFLALVTLLYIYVEVRRRLGDATTSFVRARGIFLMGVVQAAAVGLVMTSLVGPFMVSRNWSPISGPVPVEELNGSLAPLIGELPRIVGFAPFYSFPAAILLMTFLSFFIGVFLQLMWEELPITEPL